MFWKMDNNLIFKKTIESGTYASFLLANIFMIIVFNSYLHITEHSLLKVTLILLIGILLSATTLNPRWILRFIDKYSGVKLGRVILYFKHNQLLNHIYFIFAIIIYVSIGPKYFFSDSMEIWLFRILLTSILVISYSRVIYLIASEAKKHFLDLIKFSVLSSRYLFFSILNDIFVLNVFWISYLFIVYSLKILSLPSNFDIVVFVAPITLIGILSGLFKIYTESYRNQISSNAVKPITQYVQDFVQEVNPKDFIDFLKEKGNIDITLLNDFDDFVHDRGSLKREYLKTLYDDGIRPIKNVTVNRISAPYRIEPLNMFKLFDYYVKDSNKEYVGILNEYYKDYFKHKIHEFNSKLDQVNFDESRTLLFSGIFFFNDLYTEITTVNESYKRHKRETKNFMDCYNKFVRKCSTNLMTYIMQSEFSKTTEIKIEDL